MPTEIPQARYQVLTTPPIMVGDPQSGLFVPTVGQQFRLGQGLADNHGRMFRYCKNAAVQLEAALMAQSEAINANVTSEVQTGYTTAIGDTSITVLVTTSNGISDGELADGHLVTQDGTGEGYAYPIRWNEWVTSDTVMRIDLYEPIRVATAATSEFTLVKNTHSDVIVMPTTVTGVAVGVPNMVVPASYYFWAQTKGPCPMIVDAGDTLVVGALAGVPGTHGTAGAVGIPAITTDVWGRTIFVAAAGETALIDLNLE
jgi:hypothetical protein